MLNQERKRVTVKESSPIKELPKKTAERNATKTKNANLFSITRKRVVNYLNLARGSELPIIPELSLQKRNAQVQK